MAIDFTQKPLQITIQACYLVTDFKLGKISKEKIAPELQKYCNYVKSKFKKMKRSDSLNVKVSQHLKEHWQKKKDWLRPAVR
jgi:hypothetical protein